MEEALRQKTDFIEGKSMVRDGKLAVERATHPDWSSGGEYLRSLLLF
jgi:hypothetical protein